MGSAEETWLCHSYTPDGRCISLLKVLLTNFCVYDCLYCVNRSSSNVPRARFTVDEIVRLTLDFYARNYIEGLFLSSGIIRDADYTMEQLVAVARALREAHDFRGYIHLKAIPDAAEDLLAEAGLYADRLSVNVEVAKSASLTKLAPEKSAAAIKRAMAQLRMRIEAASESPKAFAPAGQSTQLVVGADDATDRDIIENSAALYASYGLRRVYYSAFSPIPDASKLLPLEPAPLLREHRLYQADRLLRHYEFTPGELFERTDGMLDLDVDPKLAWALEHRDRFPVDVNRCTREELLRVPGFGTKTVDRILAARRVRKLRVDDLGRLRVPVKRVLPFIKIAGASSGALDSERLAAMLESRPTQMALPLDA